MRALYIYFVFSMVKPYIMQKHSTDWLDNPHKDIRKD